MVTPKIKFRPEMSREQIGSRNLWSLPVPRQLKPERSDCDQRKNHENWGERVLLAGAQFHEKEQEQRQQEKEMLFHR